MGTPLEIAYGKISERGISSKFIIDATKKYADFPKSAEPPKEFLNKVKLKDYLIMEEEGL